MTTIEPSIEPIGIDSRYSWELPLMSSRKTRTTIKSVWYIGLPLSSAHRGGHSGGGALIQGISGQEKYLNEGTVYPHSALVELITYHQLCFPECKWRYLDISHEPLDKVRDMIRDNPPDVAAFSTYTATYIWALVIAAEIKRINPKSIVVFGNDHASLLRREILFGDYGGRIVDFVGLGNNGPFTMMRLLYALQEQLSIERVPSIAYKRNGRLISQDAPAYPLAGRYLPDYRFIEDYLAEYYDPVFRLWYAHHYKLKRMITLGIDAGCHWGNHPDRRCKHCAIQGLTPRTADIDTVMSCLEIAVGELGANVYAAGDSTLGFSKAQWTGQFSFLDQLAERCDKSSVLGACRFMLAYGLINEFLAVADLCKNFVRTWNVGIESFDTNLLKNDSKGINRGAKAICRALQLAKELDYRVYASGMLGLPGTTVRTLRKEVDSWLKLTQEFQGILTTVSVALPSVIPGSRMYWEMYNNYPSVRQWHGELIQCHRLSELYIAKNTEVEISDVETALHDLAKGVISIGNNGGNPVKFGGYMMGGTDLQETQERQLLDSTMLQ